MTYSGDTYIYDGQAATGNVANATVPFSHGALSGLSADDHPQYLTQTEGDARYLQNVWINVLAYGALGDGTTDDTVAVRSAITAAGAGGVLLFPPGKTYLISGQLQLLAGQTVLGYGATLKRRAQITTTTTGAIVSGVTVSIGVADASNLRVGMNVTFADSGTAQAALVAGTTLSSVNSLITNIVGNTLTLATAPNASLSSGANVYLSFYSLVLADDCKVLGLSFDGNKANWAWSRWEVENEIFTGTSTNRCMARDCYFLNSPAEGIVVNGSHHKILACDFASLNGNGVHLSGATHPIVDGCSVVSCNLNTNVGHAMGCVGWSNTIDDATVTNCYLSGGVAGIAEIDSAGNSNVTIIGNTIRSCTTYGIYVGSAAANIIIEANRVYSCGSGANGGLFVQSSTGRNINIARNLFVSCSVQISAIDMLFVDNEIDTGNITFGSSTNSKVARNFIFAGNIQITSLTACDITGNNVDLIGDTTTKCILLTGALSPGCAIRGNRLLGGANNISISANAADCMVADNDCRGGFSGGIIVDASGAQGGLCVQNNSVETTAASASSWIGMRIVNATKVSILKNLVSNQNGAHANYGILISTQGQQVVDSNMLRGTFTIAPISIASGVTGAYVTNNYTEAAIQDLGTGTVLAGNTVIV